jgi:two-component SAPR family response regulator
MDITVAVLDDNNQELEVIRRKVDKFNEASKHSITLSTFTSIDDFISNFNHDLALIDLNLGDQSRDGFDVARMMAKAHSKSRVIIFSSDFEEPESLFESFLPKCNLRISELIARFFTLQRSETRNILQLCIKGGERDVARG